MSRAVAASAVRGRCRSCKSTLINDDGEFVCSACGIVAEYHFPSLGPEPHDRPEGAGERPSDARASGETTPLLHDMGIATDISPARTDYAGKRLDPETALQMRRLRKSQKRIRTSAPKDRRLVVILANIRNICEAASLTDNVGKTASIEYRRMDKKVSLKGTSVIGMAAASVYLACKKHGVVRSIGELCRGVCASDADAAKKSKTAARCYRIMVMEMSSEAGKAAPTVPLSLYISKMINVSNGDVRIERLALQLAEINAGSEDLDGKMPHGVAAAYLYIAAILLGQPMAQREISETSHVGEVTIRSRCREVLERRRIKVVLEPAAGGGRKGGGRKGRPGGGGRKGRPGGGGSSPPSIQSLLFGFDPAEAP